MAIAKGRPVEQRLSQVLSNWSEETTMNGFTPIDPTLLPSGALAVLQPFFGDEASKPIPRPPAGAKNLSITSFSGSLSLVASVGVSDIFKVSGNYHDRALIQDIAVGQPAFGVNLPASSKILGTYWGSSLRVSVRVSGMDVTANTSLYTVAAAVQLQKAQAQYEICGIGVGLTLLADALSNLPAIGALDFSAFAQIDRFRDLLADALTAAPDQLTALPIAVQLQAGLAPSDVITEAKSIRQAMIALANGVTLKNCLATLKPGILPDVINATYLDKGLTAPETPVPNDVRTAAAAWVRGE